MDGPIIVIDHLRGSRRGQRQEFSPGERVRFGRHPDSEVVFHARRDLSASSRHAELCTEPHGDGERHVLRDVGSFNGTFVHGERVTEVAIGASEPALVEFGTGGPLVRIFIGPREQAPPVPSGMTRRLPREIPIWILVLVLGVVLAGLVAWASLV